MWFGGRVGYRLDRKACQGCTVIIIIMVIIIIIILIMIVIIIIVIIKTITLLLLLIIIMIIIRITLVRGRAGGPFNLPGNRWENSFCCEEEGEDARGMA